MSQNLAFVVPPLADPRQIGGHSFDFSRRVAVMAIVNRTPDSFYDRGATFALQSAIDRALEAVAAGADWVDVGGVPFGRGPVVSTAEELDRVIPLVEAIHTHSDVVISVDTTNAEVARLSIAAGAGVINDTSGLWDENMAGVIADSEAALVLTHSLGAPRSAIVGPQYADVTAAVTARLAELIERALNAGVRGDRLIIDPGHDLNKNTLHTLEITRRLEEVVALGPPTLVAVSNKDFIGEMLDRPRNERLEGTLAAAVVCITKGARIVRMHDVAAAVAAVRMTEGILGFRPPVYTRHNIEQGSGLV
ncbi:dihydropteroate synthase [Glaciihabitans tibetensis]|uniref:Dihydropteroate synthase n=1 Tax=Glaciihabitans tibetensis TaxID=1266600 RepID=A0A2T0VAG3_9MICO|nr:dihydropteroate synthase [Glaciihabitans tibetensis]PRY67180.1 dihydropteroate synthase [Glaciihabitans tibetensis]